MLHYRTKETALYKTNVIYVGGCPIPAQRNQKCIPCSYIHPSVCIKFFFHPLDIGIFWCYHVYKFKKKGVSFMLNMVNFVNKYAGSLAPWVSVH